MSFEQRAKLTSHPLGKKLFTLMAKKQTNLAVAADVTTKEKLLLLANQVGPDICFLKTHIDIIEDFDWDLIEQLQALAKKHNFLLIEDRKFADIGSIVQAQYTGGLYKIAQWADIVICHALAGPGIITGLKKTAPEKNRGILLLAQMSSAENLIDASYSKRVVEMAEQHQDLVVGFICQGACSTNPGFIYMTPGINLTMSGDSLGQQYNTPEYVIKEKGSDIIIVGRGIYQAQDPQVAAKLYREAAWNAYQERITMKAEYKQAAAAQ